MIGRIYLHVGTEKTGTTAIQRALASQRQAMAAKGFFVPSVLDYGGPHLKLTAACIEYKPQAPLLSGFDFADERMHAAFRDNLKERLLAEVRASGAETVVVSDEHINVHLNTPEMLRNITGMFECAQDIIHPIIFFRRQDRLLEAMMSEALKVLSIRHYDLDDPVGALKVIRYRFDYAAIIGNFSEAFGDDNLIVRGYDSSSKVNVIEQFRECTGIPLEANGKGEPTIANRSVPGRLMVPLWRIAEKVLEADLNALKSEWRSLVDKLAGRFPGEAYRLSAPVAERFLIRFAPTNDWLVDRFPGLDWVLGRNARGFGYRDEAGEGQVSIEELSESAGGLVSEPAKAQLEAAIAMLDKRRIGAPAAPKLSPDSSSSDVSRWIATCPVCAFSYEIAAETAKREGRQCINCGASGRASALLYAVAETAYGVARPIKLQKPRKELRVIGLSDGPVYQKLLSSRFNYTNTFYHQEPFLDIMSPAEKYLGSADMLITSEVFEHVVGDYHDAFRGAFAVLKPGGTMILTVPFQNAGEHLEHYPGATGYESYEASKGKWIAEIHYADGSKTFDEKAVYHGGPGKTLEMRVYSRKSLIAAIEAAGFTDIKVHDENRPEHGILWGKPSRLITATRPTAVQLR